MYIKKKKSGDDAMAQPEVPDDVDVVAQREVCLMTNPFFLFFGCC